MNSKFEIEDGGKIMTEIFENGMWRRVGNISLRSYEDFKKRAIVFGAGGFIGSHLVKRLKKMGYWVRGVDLKYPEFCSTVADDFIIGDLRYREVVDESARCNYCRAKIDNTKPKTYFFQRENTKNYIICISCKDKIDTI